MKQTTAAGGVDAAGDPASRHIAGADPACGASAGNGAAGTPGRALLKPQTAAPDS
jgi:hypothetical protein